jgi:hypothetical protein
MQAVYLQNASVLLLDYIVLHLRRLPYSFELVTLFQILLHLDRVLQFGDEIKHLFTWGIENTSYLGAMNYTAYLVLLR